jgi:cold shock CspA family protein
MLFRLKLFDMEASNKSLTGTIIWYDSLKGFGFIKPDSGTQDVFIHATSLEHGYTPATGDMVRFTPSERMGRPFAKNVHR